MKILIVYFSRSGYTQRVAERLSVPLNATLMPITEARSRLGVLGYLRCLIEASFGIDAAINASPHDPAAFDLVLLGTPIWGWHLSSPVRAFARRHAAALARCAFFCTMGGSGADAAFAELAKIVGQPPRATLALTDAEIDGEQAAPKIARFAATLRESAAPPH